VICRDIYVVAVGTQIWSCLNTWMDTKAATASIGPVQGIASIGGIAGGMLANAVAQRSIPPRWVIPIAPAVSLAMVGALMEFCFQQSEPAPPKKKVLPSSLGSKLALFRRSVTLRVLFGLVVLQEVVGASISLAYYIALADATAQQANPEQAQQAYSGYVYAAMNSSAATLLFVVASPILTRWGSNAILAAVASINAMALVYAYMFPGLWALAVAYVVFKALAYSLASSAMQMCYVPMQFEEQFHAKSIIDIFGYRLGKGVSAVITMTLASAGSFGVGDDSTRKLKLLSGLALVGCAMWCTVATMCLPHTKAIAKSD